ncbi:RNA polymerase sigma factor [Oceanobacillus halotolerans]|uniref:RNA polymerase sigma factor n=1 Tax=Oceanobacillus halotolerans TaxID=2663380 RepID=UPI0013DC03EE|nr:RNA polymerase sigma factor [Oceanobacillus halotolerans]
MDEFKQLYIKYRKQIYQYLFYLSGDKFTAEELTQETFFQAFKAIHQFKGRSKVSTWLFQIAKYTFYSHLRKNMKVQQVGDTSPLENIRLNEETPENIYEEKEKLDYLIHAMKKLKQTHQEIIILRIYNELSFNEIGEIFNQSATWARVNFYRAKNKLSLMMDGGDQK